MKFSLSFVSETTKLQIEKVKLLIVRIGLGNVYELGVTVCHEKKCCKIDLKNSYANLVENVVNNSTIETDASCQMLDLNATSLLEVSNITIMPPVESQILQ